MRVKALVATLSILLGLAGAAAAAGETAPSPVSHEEFGRALDELAGQLHGLGDRWRGHFSGAQPAERPLISIILSHRQELALSAPQVQELERLRDNFQKQAIRQDAALRVAEMDLTTLVNMDAVDVGAAEAKVREIERLRADLRVARIRTIEQGKAVLTPEQRGKLATLLTDPWPLTPRTGAGRELRGAPPQKL